ncbi:Tctex1 domain-containing protein [Apis cerana cerana]|uniref:Tctex1 domain-containing protein n=1 Tax=Apis cerana cerana TaxID=94128 RepID=A0A2A3EAH1_APICC|nr:Tctex1 domain-containing protein [Apis cerana cerana]
MDNHLTSQENEAPKYQNTYRLNAYNPFKIDPVDKIVKMIMINKLEDISYDGMECSKICEYKIVVNLTIIEKANQGIQSIMGFLADTKRDNYSTFTYEARTFYAYCFAFGIYYE